MSERDGEGSQEKLRTVAAGMLLSLTTTENSQWKDLKDSNRVATIYRYSKHTGFQSWAEIERQWANPKSNDEQLCVRTYVTTINGEDYQGELGDKLRQIAGPSLSSTMSRINEGLDGYLDDAKLFDYSISVVQVFPLSTLIEKGTQIIETAVNEQTKLATAMLAVV